MDCKFFHCDQRDGEWCEKYPIPRCHNRGGCEYEEEGKWSDDDLKNEEIRCKFLQHFKNQVDLSRNWNGIKITDIISWLQSIKSHAAPKEEKISGCGYEDEGKTNTVAKVDENKKIEEICDYIFKYEHYNSFYQYAVACAKAVADYKNREITKLNDKACEWIKANADKYVGRALEEYDMQYYGCISIDNLIDDFKQAMTND